jgi:hypothetical protein
MKAKIHKLGNEKYITNASGEVEFVVLTVSDYKKIIELLEDYGLGLAIKEAEGEKTYRKDEALRYLENA